MATVGVKGLNLALLCHGNRTRTIIGTEGTRGRLSVTTTIILAAGSDAMVYINSVVDMRVVNPAKL